MVKLCIDCKWCDDPSLGGSAHCTNPIFSPKPEAYVTGRSGYFFCSINRQFACMDLFGLLQPVGCGNSGKYWEPRDASK